ncbi:MAG: molecular chaperone SurA [Burkholderiales bacterium]|nr:MAG: molecular chaperone SurA [Burkholderiales bacterium]
MTETSFPSAGRKPLLSGLLVALLVASFAVQAQGLRLNPNLNLGPNVRAERPVAVDADFIVALVNAEPITNHEVRQAMRRLEQRGGARPPADELAREVLDQLISERALLQHAQETGLRVDEASLLQAEQAVAAQNGLGLEAFRRRLSAEGIEPSAFRDDLRRQILMQRLREREVGSRVQVSEADVDDAMRARRAALSADVSVNLGHVLVQVPESVGPDRLRELEARAQQAADRVRAGEEFASVARAFSDAAEAATGGQFGLRPYSRLPELFVQAVRDLPVGGVAGPLRSPAGFHVLKVIERRDAAAANARVVQTRASHILLRPGPQLSEAQAIERLAGMRQQVQAGQASFESLAREFSQDGSASEGGDLGWSEPGMFVPEFEQVMNALRPGQLSEPVVSRFGVHLIRVAERRERELSDREQRELVRAQLREQRAESALDALVQDVRGRAYVELRDPPRP